MTIAPEKALSPYQIAAAGYDEALRVSDAYRIQLNVRKRALLAAPDHKRDELQQRVDEGMGQLEAAERAEYAAWCRMEHARQGR